MTIHDVSKKPAAPVKNPAAPDDRSSHGGDVLAVIPARYGSTRFPGKPLAEIAGRPMIQHVVERVRQTPALAEVVVATDDDRIRAAVEGFGARAVMTGEHPTGTDRIAEVLRMESQAGRDWGWALNVQGDEPMIDPGDLQTLINGMLATNDGVMGTLVLPIRNEEEFNSPNEAKVALDVNGRAIYFSRAPIPYWRQPGGVRWRHVGVYLYRADFLATYTALPPTPLSEAEQLEQLRALEHGYPIHCFEARTATVSVDTPEDIERAEAALGIVE